MAAGAVPLSETLWRMQVQGKNLETPEQRAGLRKDLRAVVGEIADGTVRAYYGDHFKDRLERAFAPARRRPESGSNRGGYNRNWRPGGGRGPLYAPPIPAHRGLGQGRDADTSSRERLLIAGLLHHPELIHEVFEEVGELRLSSPVLDNIRTVIIERATSGVPLDLEGLRNNFQSGGMAEAATRLIAELTGPGIAHLARIIHSGALNCRRA